MSIIKTIPMLTQINKQDAAELRTYAIALQDLLRYMTGESNNSKWYDPLTVEDGQILSYAFDFKEGGRRHPIESFKSIQEIKDLMLKEVKEEIENNS